MYTFSLRAHHLTCEMVSSTCFYVVSHTCSINMQIPIFDFHAFCVVLVGRICLDIKLIFSLLFNSFKTILSTCTPVFCVVFWGENGCFSEIKIKKLLIIKCSSMSEECWIRNWYSSQLHENVDRITIHPNVCQNFCFLMAWTYSWISYFMWHRS